MAAKEYPLKIPLVGDSSSYRSAMRAAANDSKHFTNSVNGMSKGLTAINGPLNGVTGRVTALGSLATGTAGKIALVGAAIAASSMAVASSVKEYAAYETQQMKVAQVLEATGYAAGLSAQELSAQADAVALATLASVSEIQEAQGVLASFKSVQEETFTRAIELSQDMAAVFGGTAKDKALQLGKALESPTDGLNALKRSGVSFTESQKEMIRTLDEAGQKAEAQKLILDELQQQIGGAGAAQAQGLAGSVDTLGQRWDELQRKWAASSGTAEKVKGWIISLADAFHELGEEIDPSVESLTAKLEELENKIIIGRNKKQKRAALADRIAEIREQILLSKAQEGDMDALNQMIERTNNNISSLEEKAEASQGSGRRRGQMSRQNSGENTELSEQKQQLKELIALQTEFNRVKDVAAETKEKQSEHQYQVGLGVSPEEAAKGLESVKQYFQSREEIELEAAMLRQEKLDAALDANKTSDDEWHALSQENWQRHQQKLTEIQDKESKKRANAERANQKAVLSAVSSTTGDFLEVMENAGKEQSVAYKALFAMQRASQVAMTIANANAAAEAIRAREAPVMGMASSVAAEAVRGMGYASAGIIAGTAIAGAFEDGGIVPGQSYSGDNLLAAVNSGEMVLNIPQQKRLFDMANGAEASKGSASGNVIVNVNADPSLAVEVHESEGLNREQVIDIMIADASQGGRYQQTRESMFGDKRIGR